MAYDGWYEDSCHRATSCSKVASATIPVELVMKVLHGFRTRGIAMYTHAMDRPWVDSDGRGDPTLDHPGRLGTTPDIEGGGPLDQSVVGGFVG